ncbi:aldo/keto reductase [Sphaerochaeta sp. UBA5856]|uniref:aldo/keto reductase n=1 Tax=Sphaerochaeta sp. UBA5856 TaxID=1947476 RepID=UPI0025DF22FE|nr:aldo/keto reductase [Sphaerochaeta sp. UBA5856]
MKLGTTDIEVSPIALGTWAMGGGDSWGESDPVLAVKTVHRALELGINFIDTAPAYGNGLSEQLLGDALAGKRHQAVLATKCGLVWGNDDEGSVHKSRDGVTIRRNLGKQSIIKQVEESLGRLKTDYIDLLLTHWQSIPPFHTPIEETIEAFELLKQQGKIRSYGACNVSLEELKEYQKFGTPSLVQERFSMLWRDKADLASYCAENRITFQAYSPLERGVLTGKAALSQNVVGTAKASVAWYKMENRPKVMTLLTSLETMADTYNTRVGNLVIAWTRQATGTMNVLCGARKPSQIEENSKAQDLVITAKDWAIIDSLARTLL